MIVPAFWAEGRVQHKEPGRQVTVKRFGWSDVSQEDAQSHADARAHEALQRILAGDKLPRRETKASYNGADGMPIREEIISRHGETIITRNLYGALCLNTPGVLFVDIDFDPRPRFSFGCIIPLLLIAASVTYAVHAQSLPSLVLAIGVSFLLTSGIISLMNAIHRRLAERPSVAALRRIGRFSATHPDWHLRVYETPAGLRVLVMHTLFESSSPEVAECFAQLQADPIYVQMCLNQRCFRARVSPKPWRIGISQHIKPSPGIWPVKPQHLPSRRQWVATYNAKAIAHASCRFLQTFGATSRSHPTAKAVRNLHDDLSRAHSGLPLA